MSKARRPRRHTNSLRHADRVGLRAQEDVLPTPMTGDRRAVNLYAGVPLKGGCRDEIVIAHPANRRVGVKIGKDWVVVHSLTNQEKSALSCARAGGNLWAKSRSSPGIASGAETGLACLSPRNRDCRPSERAYRDAAPYFRAVAAWWQSPQNRHSA